MTVKIKLVGIFTQETGWRNVLEIDAQTPLECLKELEDRYPGVKKWIYDKNGKMWNIFQMYVNDKLITDNQYSDPLNDGDELRILLNILGVKYGR